MQLKTFIYGGTSALFLALTLAGCNGSGGNAGGAGTSLAGGGGATSGSSSDALATVGGTPITRGQLTTLLEGLAGPRVLPELIDEQLLTEALKAKGGSVSDAELTAEVARLSERDPALKAAVDAGGARAEVPRLQARRSLTIQKLLTAGIDAKDADVQAFYQKFASYYDTPAQNKIGILAATTKTRADQLARSLAAKPDSFASLVAEQKKTNDPIGASLSNAGDSPTTRFETPDEFGSARLPPQALPQLGPALAPIIKALGTAKKGQILPVTPLTPRGPYIIVRVLDRKEVVKADFAKIKDEVTTDYKLAQAAQAEIKKNPTNPGTLEQNVKQVVSYLAQPNQQTGQPGIKATLRDALTFILQQASQTLLAGLRTNGSVQISNQDYKEVARNYTAAPAGSGTTPGAAIPGANPASPAGNSAAGATTSNAASNNSAAPTGSAAPASGTSNTAGANAAASSKTPAAPNASSASPNGTPTATAKR